MRKGYQLLDGKIVEDVQDNPAILVAINPDDKEKRFLIDRYRVDEHTLASALDPDELSRLEFEPDHLAIIYKRPKNYSGADQLLFKVASTGLFVFKDRLLVVLNEDIALFNDKRFNRVTSFNDMMLKLIYGSIFHYLEHLRIITAITDGLERKISSSLENKYLVQFFSLQRSLVYYLNSINSNSVLMERIKNAASRLGFAPEESEFLDDIIIENSQCYKQAEIYSNILASLMDARASIVSNNINILMKTLNLITIGIMVPTLVVSTFSMNVVIPLQHYPHAFWVVLGLSLASLAGVMTWWRLKKW